MADGRRLAFEDSRKLGVTCKATLRKKKRITMNHQSLQGRKFQRRPFFSLTFLREVVTSVGEAIAKNGNLSVRISEKNTGEHDGIEVAQGILVD